MNTWLSIPRIMQYLKSGVFRVPIIYAAFSAGWILWFDSLVLLFVTDSEMVSRIQTVKWWMFVIFSALLIYRLLHKEVAAFRQTEQVLLRSRMLFQDLIEGISEWIWEVDCDGRIIYASPQIKDMLGYEPEDVIGKPPFDLQPEEEAEKSREFFRKLVASREPFHGFVTVNRHKDGRLVVLETSGMPIFDEAGNLLGYRGMDRDITSDIHAQDQAKESERKLLTLMGNIQGMAYRCRNDRNWTMEFVSDGCEGLTGYPPDDLLENRTVAYNDLIHPDDRDYVWDDVQKGVRRNAPFQLNYRIVTASGDIKWVWEQGVGVFSEGGDLIALEGFISDVTQQRHAEEETRQNYAAQSTINALLNLSQEDIPLDELLRRAVELIMGIDWLSLQAIGCSIYLVEDEADVLKIKAFKGIPESLEKACERVPFDRCLCGRAASSATVQFAHSFDECRKFGCEDVAPHGHYCAPILIAGKAIGVVNLYLQEGHRHDSREEDFLTSVAGTLAVIAQRRRMTEEKDMLERQLRQAQKMEAIGTLAGGIAHDFNNILMAIFGYAEMARDGLPPESPASAQIDEVLRAAYRARDLAKQILSFSRQGEQVRKPIQPHLIVKEAVKLLRASIPSTIEITQNIDPECGYMLADATQIHQVVMNLCTNAYQAMRAEGGVLAVSLTKVEIGREDVKVTGLDLVPGSYLKLEVSDSGHGMDRATMERIFEPYFTTKEKGEGTGLGLSVVHGIVKSHKGHITVYSEPGKGSTFNVYLPRIVTITEAEELKLSTSVPRGSERILLIDDENTIAVLEKNMLESLGYQVVAVTSSEDALRMFRDRPDHFDLVITDMTMPVITGIELAQHLLEIRPDMPVILCTGFSELINEEKAKALGIREYIMKPIVRNQMAKTVRKVLDDRGGE